jgi:hypothetical protein
MYLAYQGLPRTWNTFNTQSFWRPFYAVVTSVPITSIDPTIAYQASCDTVYRNFQLVFCDHQDIYCTFQEQGPPCRNCLIAQNHLHEYIEFCDGTNNFDKPCLVGIRNLGDDFGQYPDNCYIEVFFVGIWEELPPAPAPGPIGYKGGTIISSLKWSATADFMKQSFPNGVMLNCTNHTIP